MKKESDAYFTVEAPICYFFDMTDACWNRI